MLAAVDESTATLVPSELIYVSCVVMVVTGPTPAPVRYCPDKSPVTATSWFASLVAPDSISVTVNVVPKMLPTSLMGGVPPVGVMARPTGGCMNSYFTGCVAQDAEGPLPVGAICWSAPFFTTRFALRLPTEFPRSLIPTHTDPSGAAANVPQVGVPLRLMVWADNWLIVVEAMTVGSPVIM